MTQTIHYCTFCDYKSDRKHDRDRHVTRKHDIYNEGAPTSMTQPAIDYSSAVESRQHLTGYQVRVDQVLYVIRTTQQYDPRAKPQIQNNEVKHKGKGPQTSVSYSVTQKPKEDTDNETDTETVSEADTEDLSDGEEYNVYEILNDISLTFNHLKRFKRPIQESFTTTERA